MSSDLTSSSPVPALLNRLKGTPLPSISSTSSEWKAVYDVATWGLDRTSKNKSAKAVENSNAFRGYWLLSSLHVKEATGDYKECTGVYTLFAALADLLRGKAVDVEGSMLDQLW